MVVPDSSIPEDLTDLPGLLVHSVTGINYIYEVLDRLVQRYKLRDLAVVIDNPTVGRQCFRWRRRLLRPLEGAKGDSEWARSIVDAVPGVYPLEGQIEGPVSAFVRDLCALALRLDLLHHDASRDPLTGLYNRRSYELFLEQAAARQRRYGWPFGLVLFDLDGFKLINDRFGHAAGDRVLRLTATELRSSLRSGDIAARIGGDEFALIVANAETTEVLAPLVERLTYSLAVAVPELPIGFSVGVALFPAEADAVRGLSELADQRLYEHKAVKRAELGDRRRVPAPEITLP
jgi:diguanylate cyclase (GGDEF)-like protein